MLRLIGFILSLTVFPCIAFAQGNIPKGCPDILVTGPAGIVLPDENASFTVNVGDLNGSPEPKYKWSVTGGKIIQGDGQRTISVRFDGSTLTATVEVLGLPAGCPTTISETMPYCGPLPSAEKIGEARSIDAKKIQAEFNRVFAEKFEVDDRLYIMIGVQNGSKEQDAKRLEKFVVDALSRPSGHGLLRETRTTIVHCGSVTFPLEIWRVPFGADNPPCSDSKAGFSSSMVETQEDVKCPTITVIGPAGQIRTGSEINFTADVTDTDLDSLVFRWLTSGGKIVAGQGSPSIRVTTTRADNGTTLTAYLTVIGLPDSCSRIAEGEAVVQDGGDPPLIDEFGVLSDRDLRKRLKFVATELKRWPKYHLYVISYTKPTEQKVVSTRRQERIRRILIENAVPPDSITMVDGGSINNKVYTRFYAVPPKT